jgi:sugar lactone lactonase YvrE
MVLASGFVLTTDTNSQEAEMMGFNGKGKVIVRGSPIHGANGIYFDKHDRLHIASVMGGEIIVMDPMTGTVLDRLGSDVGVMGPDDCTFGPDGSLYWTDIMIGEVGRLTPGGVVTKQFVAVGVNPITFSDDGRLFVALDFMGDAIYELDPNLVNPPRLIRSNVGMMNGMDWGPDGYLYGPIITQGRVAKVDVDTGALMTAVAGFVSPAAVKFNSLGQLHVGDSGAGTVIRVDISTKKKTVVATGLEGLDNLAFDSHDRLFVSNFQNGSIHWVRRSGKLRQISGGGMITPAGVAVMPPAPGQGRESVFIADLWCLREFHGGSGRQRSVEDHNLVFPGGITSPLTVAADGSNLIVSSWFGGTVQIWDPKTRRVLKDLMYPPDFVGFVINAIGHQDDLVIAEFVPPTPTMDPYGRVVQVKRNNIMNRVTLAEGLVEAFGIPLVIPAGLASAGDTVWVSDWATGIVWQISSPGVLFPVATGLSNPEGLAVDLDGSLLVVESGAGRLTHINLNSLDPATGLAELTTLVTGFKRGAEAIAGTLPLGMLNGVAVGPKGDIYVTGDRNNVLYRFKPSSKLLDK